MPSDFICPICKHGAIDFEKIYNEEYKEKFEKAKELEAQIDHISKVIEFFEKYDYKLVPPTRMSNYNIYLSENSHINLNEGEVVYLRKALEDEKYRLQQEFTML